MRRILLSAVLAGSAWAAHAEPTTWTFTYAGFHAVVTHTTRWEGSTTTEGWQPDATISGSFSGSDANADGLIALSELTSFTAWGINYFSCMESPSPYGRCNIGRFTYALGGGLDFSAGWYGYDEYYSGWGDAITSGVQANTYTYGPFSDTDADYYWTDATRLDIVQTPVPEPGGGAMAAAGVLLLAGLGSRRGRKAPGGGARYG